MTFDIKSQGEEVKVKGENEEEEYNPEVSPKKTQSKDWELDVRALISSRKWLQNYGLKRNRLTLYQILPVIGFRLADGKCYIIIQNYGLKHNRLKLYQILPVIGLRLADG